MANNGVCGVGVAYNARIGGGCVPWSLYPILEVGGPFWWECTLLVFLLATHATFPLGILLTIGVLSNSKS